MKKTMVLGLLGTMLLVGCTDWGKKQPSVGADAETVQLVLYYSDGDRDFKTIGETMLISTGETLKVDRNVIRPSADLITGDWNNKFLPAIEAPPTPGSINLRLDRKKGVVCLAGRCSDLYYICPPESEKRAGGKCVSFARK